MASFWTKYRRNKQEVESLHSDCSKVIKNDSNLTSERSISSDSYLDDSIESDTLDSCIEEERDSIFPSDEEAPPVLPDLATELKQ